MKKLSRALFFMRTAKNNLTVSVQKSLFYSLFHSNIYGIHVWSCASPSTYACIFLKQKMSIRLIFNASYNIHTASLFKKAAVLPLVSLIEFFCLQFIQRFLQRFLPVSFNETWVTDLFHRQDFQIELRNDADLYIPFAHTALIEHQPLTKFPKLWHFPDENIKFQRNKLIFNSMLKNHYLFKLNANYRCVRLLCPHCNQPDRL